MTTRNYMSVLFRDNEGNEIELEVGGKYSPDVLDDLVRRAMNGYQMAQDIMNGTEFERGEMAEIEAQFEDG